MNNLQVKVKTFIKENKKPIIIGGVVITGIIAYKMHIRNIQRDAFRKGVGAGFQWGIDWFDNHFEDVKLRGLWEKWALENPDKVVTY